MYPAFIQQCEESYLVSAFSDLRALGDIKVRCHQEKQYYQDFLSINGDKKSTMSGQTDYIGLLGVCLQSEPTYLLFQIHSHLANIPDSLRDIISMVEVYKKR